MLEPIAGCAAIIALGVMLAALLAEPGHAGIGGVGRGGFGGTVGVGICVGVGNVAGSPYIFASWDLALALLADTCAFCVAAAAGVHAARLALLSGGGRRRMAGVLACLACAAQAALSYMSLSRGVARGAPLPYVAGELIAADAVQLLLALLAAELLLPRAAGGSPRAPMALGALSVLLSSLSLAVRRAPELWPAPQLPRLWAELDPALLALELLRWATPLDSTASLAAALSRPISLAALSVPAFVVANVALVALLDCQWRCRGASVGPPRPTVTLAAAFLGALAVAQAFVMALCAAGIAPPAAEHASLAALLALRCLFSSVWSASITAEVAEVACESTRACAGPEAPRERSVVLSRPPPGGDDAGDGTGDGAERSSRGGSGGSGGSGGGGSEGSGDSGSGAGGVSVSGSGSGTGSDGVSGVGGISVSGSVSSSGSGSGTHDSFISPNGQAWAQRRALARAQALPSSLSSTQSQAASLSTASPASRAASKSAALLDLPALDPPPEQDNDVGGCSVASFARGDVVAAEALLLGGGAAVMTVGAVAGYYLGAYYSNRIPAAAVRQLITTIGFIIAGVTFYQEFLR